MTGLPLHRSRRDGVMKETAPNIQVIIGFAESFSAPEVVWSLVGCGFPVLAFARRGSAAALRASRHAHVFDVTAPEQDAGATVRELTNRVEQILRAGGVRVVLLPLDDAALWVFGEIRTDEHLLVVGGGKPKFLFALDKELQIAAAREAGFRVPRTLVARDPRCVDASQLDFPIFLKPARAVSCQEGRLIKRKFHTCRDRAELGAVLPLCEPGEPMLAQQYVAGVGEGLFGLATQRGVLAWSAHRRIRMMNPLGSGASACRSISADPADIEAGARMIQRVSWTGPFMIELLRDDSGKSWFMEFNGRVWGSTALARRCGLEYPAWAVMEAIGHTETIPAQPQTAPGVVCRHAGRETMHAMFVMRGSRGRATAKWPSRWRTLRQLLTFRTSEHWYNWRRDDWRVFVRDFASTIRAHF
jgi:hypothetical protein